jgi:hypothetical protein
MTIIQGASAAITVQVRTQAGDALDLSDATDVYVRLRKTDRSALVKQKTASGVSVQNALNGKLTFHLSIEDTNTLFAMQNAPVEIWIDFAGGIRRIAQIRTGLNVLERLI